MTSAALLSATRRAETLFVGGCRGVVRCRLELAAIDRELIMVLDLARPINRGLRGTGSGYVQRKPRTSEILTRRGFFERVRRCRSNEKARRLSWASADQPRVFRVTLRREFAARRRRRS